MKKTFVMCVSLIAAFAVLIPSAEADHAYKKKRRPSFFEALFGGVSSRNEDSTQRRKRPWWENRDDSVRIVYGTDPPPSKRIKRKKPAIALLKPIKKFAYVDPEVAEGLGLGNLPYVLPKLNPLFDPAFRLITTAQTDSEAIRVTLSDRKTTIRAIPAIQEAVLAHYKATDFAPLWTKEGRLTERGQSLLASLAAAASEGLDPTRYLPNGLDSYANADEQVEGDSLAIAQLDVSLTANAIAYATHLSGGAFEPAALSGYHDLKNNRVEPAVALKVLAWSGFPAQYLAGLSPKHPAYGLLKAELAKLTDATLISDEFPKGAKVRLGQTDNRMEILRVRMVKEGYLTLEDADVGLEKRDVLDKRLSKALKSFQAFKGLPLSGNLDAPSMKALAGPDTAVARERLLSSLERLRWMPHDFGARHVFVNQASYRVDVMEQGKAIWSSKVIVGKPFTQTAVFSDQMETVVFNPAWNLPQSILLKEYLPKLRRDPRYLDKIGFKVLNSKGEITKSSNVNWASVGSNTVIGVQQPPGGANALGEVKFLFPNKHSIYMHDTPNRNLFREARRNFSHGCVRVENPREFASVLLGWQQDRVDENIDSGESTSVKLEHPIPVHLTYFTAWPDLEGKIQYYSDPYERDLTLLQARTIAAKLYDRKNPQRIVENRKISTTSLIE